MADFLHVINIDRRTKSFSNGAILLVGIVWLFTLLGGEKWQDENTIKDDIIYYYSYLPALFVYSDISFQFVDTAPKELSEKIWLNKDYGIPKMTIGLSLLYAPFFLIAHVYESLIGVANGYTASYHLMLMLAGVFYGLLGLVFLKKTLLLYFEDTIVAVSIIILAIGTNLYYYAAYYGAMSHVYSFFLFSAFIYYSLKWNSSPTKQNSILLGFISGMIVLVRPVNALICLLPLFVQVYSFGTLKTKTAWLIEKHRSLLVVVFIGFLCLLPQLLYWKCFTGSWLYYGYGQERFFFQSPHIIDGLFSYRKGWLVYTPIMGFSILGMLKMKRYCKDLSLFILFYFPLTIYLLFSWWCWWYGGSFGARSLIESYAILSLPLSAFIAETIKLRFTFIKCFFGLLAGFFILLNVFQSKQYDVAILHWDSMTKKSYWAIWGKSERPENYLELISPPDYHNAKLGKNKLFDGN